MKKLLFAGSVLILASCANNNPRLTDQPQYSSDGTKSYSQEHMQKTGRQTTAEALAQEDPSVSISHR